MSPKKNQKPKPKRINKPTNLTLPEDLKSWANEYAGKADFKNLSGLVTALLREEKRKGGSLRKSVQDVVAEQEAAKTISTTAPKRARV